MEAGISPAAAACTMRGARFRGSSTTRSETAREGGGTGAPLKEAVSHLRPRPTAIRFSAVSAAAEGQENRKRHRRLPQECTLGEQALGFQPGVTRAAGCLRLHRNQGDRAVSLPGRKPAAMVAAAGAGRRVRGRRHRGRSWGRGLSRGRI